MGNRQQVEHRVGRASHGDIQRHGVQESLAGGNASGQYVLVPVAVILVGIFHDEPRRILEKNLAVGMSGKNGAVSGQSQTDSLVQAIHRIGGEHTRAASASGARMTLDFSHVGIAHARVCRLYHRVNQVEVHASPLARFHRSARYKNGRDVQPHGSHQHPRRNLVAIRNANHRVRLVRVDHILDAIGDDVARRQGIKHPVVPHGNAVINGNGVKLGGKASQTLYLRLYHLPDFVQVRMPGHKLGERIDHRYNRLTHHLFLHSVGYPQRTCACHAPAFGTHRTT